MNRCAFVTAHAALKSKHANTARHEVQSLIAEPGYQSVRIWLKSCGEGVPDPGYHYVSHCHYDSRSFSLSGHIKAPARTPLWDSPVVGVGLPGHAGARPGWALAERRQRARCRVCRVLRGLGWASLPGSPGSSLRLRRHWHLQGLAPICGSGSVAPSVTVGPQCRYRGLWVSRGQQRANANSAGGEGRGINRLTIEGRLSGRLRSATGQVASLPGQHLPSKRSHG